MNLLRELPGIRFKTQAPVRGTSLPRMDIAGFVGFVSRKPASFPEEPFHQAVLVEDIGQFRDYFGEDVPLAWDPQTGTTVSSSLGPAVSAFFQNRGRRCWVVGIEPPAALTASAFLDARFQHESVVSLPVEMRKHLAEHGGTGTGENALKGIYSLYPIEEISLLAVPDAVHPGWIQATPPAPQVLVAPEFESADVEGLQRTLVWSDLAGATEYQLEESVTPDFAEPREVYRGADRTAQLTGETNCVRNLYYRVRQRRGSLVGPWSDTVRLSLDSAFTVCGQQPLQTPRLQLDSSVSPPEPVLRWEAVPSASEYQLQEAFDPAFQSGRIVLQTETQLEYSPTVLDRITYYRVRALRDSEAGPWSITRIHVPEPLTETTLQLDPEDSSGAQHLLAVQRAMLRFCAARGDVMAVMGLPRHYRKKETLEHVRQLRSSGNDTIDGVPELRPDELRALSYGAMYHPWLANQSVRNLEEGVAFRPPHGTMCGLIARRTLDDGAWYAPANMVADGVVALEPALTHDDWEELYRQRVNLVRPDPRGFVPWSADTLSLDERLRPINVRRLLILLLRLMRRAGEEYVFETNDDRLRSRVENRFRQVLEDLYERGAFAGDTPSRAFQVRADRSVNPPESIDRGRLIVEIRVAPSRPLEFITVFLIQHDTGTLLLEES